MKFTITRGKVKHAIRLVAYGAEGIGKSTFASKFPEPLFIDVEDGTKTLDVARFPKPDTWETLLEEIDAVINEPDICKTLVIDTIDRAEALLVAHLLEEGKVPTIEKYGGGFGKGYTKMAEDFYNELLTRLDKLIAKGVNVVLLAHAAMRKFEAPDDQPYDRWELKVNKKVAPLVKEWADILLFMNYEVMVVEEKNGRTKAKGAGKRVMYANHHSTYDAKNRYGLPDEMELSFKPLKKIYDGMVPEKEEKTVLSIDHPDEGIVEDDMLEDPRKVLMRYLTDQGITEEQFNEWLIGRDSIPEGETYMRLSGSAVTAMLKHKEQLTKVLGGK